MRYYNIKDSREMSEALADPKIPVATLDSFLEVRLIEMQQDDVVDEAEAMKQKVISTRLDVGDIYLLDEIAKKLADTRSGLAREILEIGIEQLRAKLGIRRLTNTHMSGTLGGATTLADVSSGEPKVVGTYDDDALQIGGGDR